MRAKVFSYHNGHLMCGVSPLSAASRCYWLWVNNRYLDITVATHRMATGVSWYI